MQTRSPLPLVLCLCASAFGCATTARDVARELPPPVINSTLRAFNDRENQRLLTQLMSSPEMHEAARAFAGEVADGALGALSEPERVARIEAMSERYVATLARVASRGMAEGLRRDLGPAMVAVMRDAVGASMREMLREGYQRDMERVAAGLTRATVDAASRGVAEGMRRDLGPAIEGALNDERTARSVGAMMRVITREAVLGSNDAMTQVQRAQERSGTPSFLGGLTNLTRDGVRILELVSVAAVGLSFALALWVARLVIRSRRVRAESERNAASALLLAEAIRAAEGKPWASELSELLRARVRRDSVGDLLDEVLGTRPPEAPRKAPRERSLPPSPPLHHGA